MESVLYIKIRHSNNPVRQCPANALATCWELLFAAFASLICASYALHHEDRISSLPTSAQPAFFSDTGYFSFVLNPPPALMLSACIFLGCSISSFAYRRQQEDRFQPLVFVTAIVGAIVLGFAVEMDANLIMLALIPAALCLAMVASVFMHWLIRSWRQRTTRIEIHCCELGEKEKREKDNTLMT